MSRIINNIINLFKRPILVDSQTKEMIEVLNKMDLDIVKKVNPKNEMGVIAVLRFSYCSDDYSITKRIYNEFVRCGFIPEIKIDKTKGELLAVYKESLMDYFQLFNVDYDQYSANILSFFISNYINIMED